MHEGTVRTWHGEKGWGVIDCPATPGGCWAHFSHVVMAGYRESTLTITLDDGTVLDGEQALHVISRDATDPDPS